MKTKPNSNIHLTNSKGASSIIQSKPLRGGGEEFAHITVNQNRLFVAPCTQAKNSHSEKELKHSM